MSPIMLFTRVMLILVLSGAISSCSKSLGEDASPELPQASLKQTPAPLLPTIAPAQRVAVSNHRITNLEAPIPSQCYTKTENKHNPCYTCHQMYDREAETRMNMLDDGGLQGAYIFSEDGLSNHWQNLFVDRREWLAQISDDTIDNYVNQDNYSALAGRLKQRGWQGFVPDLSNFSQAAAAFDSQGFARDGSGWVAFNYKPFPGTFWPTNGSTDDVVIRLPKIFRELKGVYDRDVYLVNLSLVEMAIKNLPSISIPAMDERRLGRDLNGDGVLTQQVANLVRQTYYTGDAEKIEIALQQYPQGAELMHSVRYVGSDAAGNIYIPERLKELRYMKKIRVIEQHDLDSRYARERKEKNLELLPSYNDHGELGMENGMGWLLQGFIEDYEGELRPQTHEETFYCMGCHAAIGVTIDQTFALARKVTGAQGWGYINLIGMPDAPNINEPGGEISNYLTRAGGGSEFRENPEMLARWFDEQGQINQEKLAAADVYSLITPSRERALQLNKAYTHIVRNQSYIYGRDATWLATQNVFDAIDESTPPLPAEHRRYQWDIRLDWSLLTPP